MRHYKVVITGPFAAGKTTFINTITEIAPVQTEAKIIENNELTEKDSTTVAMDFGRITFDGEKVLHIFGTPGQFRFNYMWSVLVKDALGIIILIDSGDPSAIGDAKDMLNFFRVKTDAPLVVALNNFEGKKILAIEELRKRLSIPKRIPVIECNAKDKESVKTVLLYLLNIIVNNERIFG